MTVMLALVMPDDENQDRGGLQ